MPDAIAKIYQPAKTAMQSGRAKTACWMLEYKPQTPKTPEPLMGWNSAGDTLYQVRLLFPTREAAVAYATAKEIPFELVEPHAPKSAPKAYASNFASGRRRAYAGNA